MEASAQALRQRSTVTSTPEDLGQKEEPKRRCVEPVASRNAMPKESNSCEPPIWKMVDLEKWHIKFDGTRKGMSVE
ncbi:unnamed protein product, partial [Ceratitis capitata]